MANKSKITVLLVHGAWHGAWCWKYLLPCLEDLDYLTATVDLPCVSSTPGTTQFDDVACIRAKLQDLFTSGQQVLVVGHSYAGTVAGSAISGLSEAERSARGQAGGVIGYIGLCAYLLPGGADQGAMIDNSAALQAIVQWNSPKEGLFVCTKPRESFCEPDVQGDLAEWALSQLRPQSMAANRSIVPVPAWENDLAHYTGKLGYIKATADPIVTSEAADGFVAIAGGPDVWKVVLLEGSGHSPFLSRPSELAATIQKLAQQF